MCVALAKLEKNVMLCVMLSLSLAPTPFACKNRIVDRFAEPEGNAKPFFLPAYLSDFLATTVGKHE